MADQNSALPESPPDGSDSGAEPNSGNREAMNYRKKLRAAEAKLEAAEKRVNSLLRVQVESLAAKELSVASDLFDIGGASIEDLTDPEGNVMPDAVDAAVKALLAKRPGLRNGSAPWGDVGGGRRGSVPDSSPTMRDALKLTRH
ncbi:hypothetical protein J7E93_09410 [Streptomyces sp. ISL-36]|uniref:hypothetical protein n=1 Tax=Streptomyces sp. ISL-36 TaxID=2819182 RepID=UPI001BE7791A|nr:hypothetical protein [Streptomyces sp. ISL-36]MBT2440322.1 hypothetical protein [Streptomyces sp. ISL-36]